MKPRVDRIALIALLVLAVFVAGRAWLHQHPEHNPWAPLDLNDPPGWATARKVVRLRNDPDECRATLRRSGVEFTPLPPLEAGQCPRPDRIVLATEAVALRPARPEATCAVEAGLVLWLRNGVQPAAREFLNSEVVAIEHYGTHSCRRIYGREGAPWSEHASGNAIDVAGFLLADGRWISVRNDWAVGRNRGTFLHAVHDAACGAFGTVLGPDYNAAHADHFHLDQAGRLGWSLCR